MPQRWRLWGEYMASEHSSAHSRVTERRNETNPQVLKSARYVPLLWSLDSQAPQNHQMPVEPQWLLFPFSHKASSQCGVESDHSLRACCASSELGRTDWEKTNTHTHTSTQSGVKLN